MSDTPQTDEWLAEDIEALREANYEFTQEIHGLREQRDVIMQRLSETHMRMTETEKQRDRLAEALRGLSQPLGRYDYTVAELDDIVRKIALEALAAVKGEEPVDPHKHCRGGGGNNFHCGCKYDA
jgi:uncharacterized coiled-coil DUF342 family protein